LRNILFCFTFLVLLSCEYHREQKIPEGLQSILKNQCVLPSLYSTKVYEIKHNSQLNEWEKNLFCEGHDDKTKLQSWTTYMDLPEKEREFLHDSIEYWKENSEECDVFKNIELDKIYFAACLTENINPSTNEVRTFYHSMYILNKDKTVFIDIQYLQSI